MARGNQTFYTGHVDVNLDWRIISSRVKSDTQLAHVTTALGQVCPTFFYNDETGWAGGAVDREIPSDAIEAALSIALGEMTLIHAGEVPHQTVEQTLGIAATDAIMGPRPIEVIAPL